VNSFSRCLILLGSTLLVSHPCAQQNSDPRVQDFNRAYAEYQSLAEAGNFRDALPNATQALILGEEIFGEKHENTATLTFNLGDALLRTRHGEDARRVLKIALARYEAIFGQDSEELIPVLISLGKASLGSSIANSETKFRRALQLIEKYDGKETDRYAWACIEVGDLLLRDGQPRDGKVYLDEAYGIFESIHGANHPSVGIASFMLGKYWLLKGSHEEARDYFLRALNSFEDPNAPSSQIEMSTHAFLVDIYENLDQSDEATQHCLAIGRMSPVEPDQDYQPLFRMPPEYPTAARRSGHQGYIDLEFTVDENGFVRDPVVLGSGDRWFKKAAFEAVEKWRYAPRFVDNKAVATEGVTTRLTFRFVD
jgi:TonB family protein